MTTARTLANTILSKDVLKGSASALVIKFTGSVLGFTMFALAARAMEPHDFGNLAIIFNAMSFLAIIATCGQETLIVRSWVEYRGSDRPGLARGALAFGVKVVAGAGLITAAMTALTWPILQPGVPLALVASACAFLLLQNCMNFSGHFSRVAAGMIVGETPREIAWRLVVVVILVGHQLLHTAFTATEFFATAAVGLGLSILLQQLFVVRALPHALIAGQAQYQTAEWIPRSFRMWLAAILETSSQYLEVIVIGFFLGPTAAAFYFVATRITNVFAMLSGSITAYATMQMSDLFHRNAKGELQAILRALAIINAALAAGAFLVVVFGGKLLLWMFGTAYVSAYPALLILAAGASIGALSGPASYLLLLTGNEGAYPRILAGGLLGRFVLIAVLGPWLGLIGAAIAWSVAAVGTTLVLVMACRQRTGVDPSLLGNVLQLRAIHASLKGSLR